MFRTVLRRRSPAAGLVAALVVAIAAAGVAAGQPSPAGAQQRHAVVVSDSILLGAQGPLSARLLSAGWTVDFDGAVSRSTSAGADAVRAKGQSVSDTLVVSLGANDSGNSATFRSRVEAVMSAAAHVPHVYWITIREVRPYYAPANQVLRDAALRHRNLTIVDWNAASAGRSGLTASDGLHLTPSGATELSNIVAGAVLSAAPAPTAPPNSSVPTAAPVAPAGAPVPAEPPAPSEAPVAETPPAQPAPSVGSAPELAVTPVGEATAATSAFDRSALDRSAFVEPAERTSAALGALAAPGEPRGGEAWGLWVAALMLVAAAGGFAVLRRMPWMPYALRSASVPVRRAGVTRSEMRAARISTSQRRHPSTAAADSVPQWQAVPDLAAVSDPMASDPVASDPVASDPAASDPMALDPAVQDLAAASDLAAVSDRHTQPSELSGWGSSRL